MYTALSTLLFDRNLLFKTTSWPHHSDDLIDHPFLSTFQSIREEPDIISEIFVLRILVNILNCQHILALLLMAFMHTNKLSTPPIMRTITYTIHSRLIFHSIREAKIMSSPLSRHKYETYLFVNRI